jgi:carbon monoxide dehydrogenase subunit G
MPVARTTVSVPVEQSRVAAFLRDLNGLASLLPQVKKVEAVNETSALWTIDLQLGPIHRTSVYRGELVRADDTRIEFKAQGKEAEIRGAIQLTPADGGRTTVAIELEATGVGNLRAIIDNVLARRLPEDLQGFAALMVGHFSRSLPSASSGKSADNPPSLP